MTTLQIIALIVLGPLVLISAVALATEKSRSPVADLVWMLGGTAAILLIVNDLIGS